MESTADVANRKLQFPIAQPHRHFGEDYSKTGNEHLFSRHHQNGQTLAVKAMTLTEKSARVSIKGQIALWRCFRHLTQCKISDCNERLADSCWLFLRGGEDVSYLTHLEDALLSSGAFLRGTHQDRDCERTKHEGPNSHPSRSDCNSDSNRDNKFEHGGILLQAKCGG